MKALTFIIILVWLTFSVASAQDNPCVPASGDPIHIGAIFPQRVLLSANSADSFQGAEAMRLAANACGGVNGRPVEWVLEAASDREDAAQAAQQLVEAGLPLIVGSGMPAVSEGAREITEAAGVMYWETTETIDQMSEWTFSPRPNSRQLGMMAGDFAAEHFTGDDGELRVALVYDSSDRSRAIARGVRNVVESDPIIDYNLSEGDVYTLAERIRDANIDALILSVPYIDGYTLWWMLRETDANVGAWIDVSSQGYRQWLCDEVVNVDGFISLDATGEISGAYRDGLGEIARLYRRQYMRSFGSEPTETADLAASGVYLLLRHVLPNVENQYTSEAIRAAALSVNILEVGLMGEGLAMQADGTNSAASAIFSQQQGSRFCSVAPDSIVTCFASPMSFPTWRERAVQDASRNFTCEPPT
jgi:hypothetical protein